VTVTCWTLEDTHVATTPEGATGIGCALASALLADFSGMAQAVAAAGSPAIPRLVAMASATAAVRSPTRG
jgi:hypothetical protein